MKRGHFRDGEEVPLPVRRDPPALPPDERHSPISSENPEYAQKWRPAELPAVTPSGNASASARIVLSTTRWT